MFQRFFRHINLVNNQLLFKRECGNVRSNVRHSQSVHNLFDHDSPIREKFKENRRLSKDEWEELRTKIIDLSKHITSVNIDATIIKCCIPTGQLNIGKSYIDYLKQSGIEPNLATWGSFLKLYFSANKCGVKLTNEDLRDISDLHKYLLNKYTELDPNTCENLICALVLTEDWRKTLDLIDMIKVISKPSRMTYSIIAAQAFRVGDMDLGWKLLNEMCAEDRIHACDAILSFIRYCRNDPQTFFENLDKILTFIGKNEILISKEVADELIGVFNDFGIKSCVTSIQWGKCLSCNQSLCDVALTDAEFKQLSDKMLNKVLIGKNIFLKSSPDEVTNFVNFVERTKPYDCVIDGLNVAYGHGDKSRKPRAQLVAKVAHYFVDRKKKVLVVGRRHMGAWPPVQMNYIRRNTHLFLADDLSQDDPFFLYAALRSGPKTDIISRDLLRSHIFLLDDKLKPIFRRWQRQHQFGFNPNGEKVPTFGPLQFITNAHQVNGCWHIPICNDVTAMPNDSVGPKNWLCVEKIHKITDLV